MKTKIIECVLNFSEGTNKEVCIKFYKLFTILGHLELKLKNPIFNCMQIQNFKYLSAIIRNYFLRGISISF
jgi:hypothetical protein